jgi:MFS family permease
LAELFPGYLALVMATGIIAVDALQQRIVWLARTLLWAGVVFYLALWGLYLARLVGHPQRVLADLTSGIHGGWLMLVAASGAVVATAFVVFAAARRSLAGSVVAMAILGSGVGGFSAATPQAILAVTPASQTASAMGLNQVVRAVGCSIGSATGGLVLAANTPPGHLLPGDGGYTIAALAGVAITALSIGVAAATGSRQRSLAGRPDRRRRPDG